jgi:hypothetical protein
MGDVDFDPGSGVKAHRSSPSIFGEPDSPEYCGSTDPFIMKLNSEGDFQWVTTWGGWEGGDSFDSIESVAVDPAGNVYGGGYFTSPAELIDKPDDEDVYTVVSLDSSGRIRWVNNWDTGFRIYGDVYTDSAGYVYVLSSSALGWYDDFPASFAPFITGTITSTESEFLFKLLPDGTFDGSGV